MASNTPLFYLTPEGSSPTATIFATLDIETGGSTPNEAVSILDFDTTTVEYVDFKLVLPDSYSGGGLTCKLWWSAATATTGNVIWGAAVRYMADDTDDIDSSHTYDYNDSAATAAPGAVGRIVDSSITFTDGADMDSWVVGATAIFRIRRSVGDAGDTMAGDACFWNMYIKET